VPREAAASTDALRSAARRQHSDAVGACLAVQPALYGRLLVLGTIVTSDFRKKILQADGVVRLRALDHDFVTRAQRDLPGLAELLRPDWLMAVLEGGDAAHQVHVWDLHSGRELLRVRPAVEADLMTVRWSGRGPVPTKASSDPGVQNTVRDCAIAAGVREAAGEEVPLPPTSR
jgi:hypothetical protein